MFSIVTPSFQQARYLEQNIRSIANQGCDVEHIVIDGGSRDGSIDVLHRNANVLGFWCSEPDGGQTHALLKGFARTRGDIVGWVNSDDFLLPGALRHVEAAFSRADRPDVVFGYGVAVDAQGDFLREMQHAEFRLDGLRYGFDFTQPALFFRRAWLHRVLPLNVDLHFCMDRELVSKLALSGAKFRLLPRPLAAFRIHSDAKTARLQSVHEVERRALVASLDRIVPRRPWQSKAILHAMRRLEMLRRGSVRYALFGGRLGASSEARALAAEAKRLWSGE